MSRPARPAGPTILWRRSGAARCWSTAKSTSVPRTATWSSTRSSPTKKLLVKERHGRFGVRHAGGGRRRAVRRHPHDSSPSGRKDRPAGSSASDCRPPIRPKRVVRLRNSAPREPGPCPRLECLAKGLVEHPRAALSTTGGLETPAAPIRPSDEDSHIHRSFLRIWLSSACVRATWTATIGRSSRARRST